MSFHDVGPLAAAAPFGLARRRSSLASLGAVSIHRPQLEAAFFQPSLDSGDPASPNVVDRRRIVIIEQAMEGAKQPYHFAESLGLEEAERHLQKCAVVSQPLALQAIHKMSDALTARNYRVVGCAMLLASARALPPLPKILASHALVHAAEGEFFRKVVGKACESCRIPLVGIPESELEERANATFGEAATHIRQHISSLGKTLGSPWTQDEKTAALAGLIACRECAKPSPALFH